MQMSKPLLEMKRVTIYRLTYRRRCPLTRQATSLVNLVDGATF